MYWYLVLVLATFQNSDAFPMAPTFFSEPSFCRGLECPAYKVMMKTADFEERCYAEYKWASTNESGNFTFTSEPVPFFISISPPLPPFSPVFLYDFRHFGSREGRMKT